MSTTNFSNEPDLTHGVPGGDRTSGADPGAKEQAQQAAGTAKDEGQRVAGVAKDEAQSVVRDARNQARGLLDDATSQVDAQSREQKDRLAEVVRTFGDDLHAMTSQGEGTSGLAGQVVQQVADQARSAAAHLEGREPRELLDDVRGFARRRPGTFLLGALVAGVVVGRVTRGAKDSQQSSTDGDSSVATPASSSAPAFPSQSTPGAPRTAPASSASADLKSSDLGVKGVEMSESGVVGPEGGRA
jgi:hypothetical protein